MLLVSFWSFCITVYGHSQPVFTMLKIYNIPYLKSCYRQMNPTLFNTQGQHTIYNALPLILSSREFSLRYFLELVIVVCAGGTPIAGLHNSIICTIQYLRQFQLDWSRGARQFLRNRGKVKSLPASFNNNDNNNNCLYWHFENYNVYISVSPISPC